MYIIHFIHRPNEDENEVSRIAKIKQYATPTAQENARCKVCFKKFGDGEFFKLCCSCKGKVCEDCSASYGPKEAEVSIFYIINKSEKSMKTMSVIKVKKCRLFFVRSTYFVTN